MSREIKFRAWNKEFDLMVYDIQKCESFACRLIDKNQEIMQYTGLNDKFEKEIYEGDIIEEVYLGDKNIKGKIIYNKDAFEIEWISKDHFNNNILHVRNKDIQVIGNIYEAKDLLK